MTIFKIESSAFKPEGSIPSRYTCDGVNVSPPLEWSDPPAATASFALIHDDPDAPGGDWVHWVVWNIPADKRALPENFPKDKELKDGTRQGITDFDRVGYGGPCPPSGVHRYFYKLYALKSALDLPPGATKQDLLAAMEGRTLASCQFHGTYQRRR